MSTLAKIGVGFGLLSVAYLAFTQFSKKAADYAKQVTFKITGFGTPKLASGFLSVPLNVLINNPAPLGVMIDKIIIKVSTLKYGQWIPVGETQPTGFKLNPGDNQVTLTPSLNLKTLNPLSSWGDALTQLNTLVTGGLPSISIKADIEIHVAGLIVTQSQTKTLSLNDIKSNLSGASLMLAA